MDAQAAVVSSGEAETTPSFDAFYLSLFAPLFRSMLVLSGNPAEAEDVAHEAFVRVFERWESVWRMEAPDAYLFRTALNLERNRMRRVLRRARRVVQDRDVQEDFSQDAIDRAAVVATDCGDAGGACQPLWVADAIPGSSGHVGPVIADGVVKVTTNEGDAPGNRQTTPFFDARCRDDGGECHPLWRAELGSGAAHVPGVAVGGVFYQQAGTRMLGFLARCRTDGGTGEPDFVVEATGDPQTQQSSLYGPVLHDATLVLLPSGAQIWRPRLGASSSTNGAS